MSGESSKPAAARRQGELVASKYRLERTLAQGGMGSLWVARHVELDVEVAIKFSAMERTDAHDQRFRREARAAARLKSPHIVHVFDYGFDCGEPYIAMELLQGESLRELLEREGPLPLARVAEIVAEIAKGLEVAHDAGIVHRDLKPSNLFLARQGADRVIKILDFGIAKASAESGGEAGTAAVNLGGEATRAGAIVGSPAYMSPEQARGEPVDQRSDLWSLSVVIFRLLTGAEPFTGKSATETLGRICGGQTPAAPLEVAGFFERGLERQKERRFQSAHELSRALSSLAARLPRTDAALGAGTQAERIAGALGRTGETRAIEPEPRRHDRKRALRVAAGALAVGVGVTLGLFYLRPGRSPANAESTVNDPSPGTMFSAPAQSAPATDQPSTVPVTGSERTAAVRPARAPRRKPAARAAPAPEARPENSSPTPAEPRPLDPVFGLKK